MTTQSDRNVQSIYCIIFACKRGRGRTFWKRKKKIGWRIISSCRKLYTPLHYCVNSPHLVVLSCTILYYLVLSCTIYILLLFQESAKRVIYLFFYFFFEYLQNQHYDIGISTSFMKICKCMYIYKSMFVQQGFSIKNIAQTNIGTYIH